MHEELPATDEKVPAAHGVAAVAPVAPTNEPAGAGVHTLFPVVEVKVPNPHGVAAIAPVAPTYEPAGAGVHEAWPATEENSPTGHRVDDVAPGPVAYEPAGAGVHGVFPVAEYEPAVHGVVEPNGYASPVPELLYGAPTSAVLPSLESATELPNSSPATASEAVSSGCWLQLPLEYVNT